MTRVKSNTESVRPPFRGPMSFTGTDRTTGLSKAQAAEGAACNVFKSGWTIDEVASMAVDIVDRLLKGKPVRVGALIGARAGALAIAMSASAHFVPSLKIDAATINHRDYIQDLLAPGGDQHVAGTLLAKLGGMVAETHADRLEALRQHFPKIHALVVSGHLNEALEQAPDAQLRDKIGVGIREIVKTHMKCFAIKTTHQWTGTARDIALDPYDFAFAGFKTWKFTAHVIFATLWAPGNVLQRLAVADKQGVFDNLNDNEVRKRLTENLILPDNEAGGFVFSASHAAFKKMRPQMVQRFLMKRGTVMRFTSRNSSYAANLCRGNMTDPTGAKFTQQEFLEHRIGLTAPEVAAYGSMQLIWACQEIDRLVDAYPAAPSGPSIRKTPAIVALAYPAMLLRADARCDRNATNSTKRETMTDFDPASRTGRDPVRSMLKKLKDPAVADHARRHLTIKPATWLPPRDMRRA